MHQRATFCRRRDQAEKRQIVLIDARKWQCVQLVLWRSQSRTLERDVNQARAAVVRCVFLAQLKLQPHPRQRRQFDL